jgi:lipopolysaccharide assembly outer membrane protein LptD (OstA)
MKTELRRIALLLLFPLAAFAAPAAESFLLKADSMTVSGERTIATGRATVIAQGGEMRITADSVTYDRESGVFQFSGAVAIHSTGAVIETKDATLNVHGKKVFTLSSGPISLGTAQPIEIRTGANNAEKVQLFGEPYRKLDTKLVTPTK